jgi:hypothetical protein
MIRNDKAFTKKKGIFCIEGAWVNDHRDLTSVGKALEFIKTIEKVEYIHKQCHNHQTLEELINDSMQKKYSKNSILYFAFHGKKEHIFVEKRNKSIHLDKIAEIIGERANGKIIHFGSCSTLDTSGWMIRKFLKNTKALAISGYKKDIDFLKSTLFDLLYFQQCQRHYSIKSIENQMKKYHSKLGKELGFVIHRFK